MRIRILGSAAGGGLPQWNCRCPNCRAVRSGSPHIQARTQSSLAVTADGAAWYLFNVSADVRQQLVQSPHLAPPDPAQRHLAPRDASPGKHPPGRDLRSTAIAGCILTDAEIDHTSGLLQLREGCAFGIFSTAFVHDCLTRYLPIETVLAGFAERPWTELSLGKTTELPLPGGAPSGLTVRAFTAGHEIPRYGPEAADAAGQSMVGLVIDDARTGGRLVYAPGVASFSAALVEAAATADGILIDGTFWTDEEPLQMGVGQRTSRQMGHLPVSGDEGTLAWLAEQPARHRVYVHMNNTNPMLNVVAAEHEQVTHLGIRIGMDGDVFEF